MEIAHCNPRQPAARRDISEATLECRRSEGNRRKKPQRGTVGVSSLCRSGFSNRSMVMQPQD